MTLGDKKKALNALAEVQHLQADKELLKAKKPHSHIFKRKYPSNERTHREVIWDLLSVANVADIKKHREEHAAANAPVETEEEKAIREEKEKEAQQKKEDEEKAALKQKEEEAKEAAEKDQAIEAAKLELASLDLENKPNYRVMQSIIAALDIETTDRKSPTFTAALVAYKSTMLIAEAVSPEELEKAQEENEELKDNLEETTEELEKAQEEKEELKDNLEETTEELEQTQEQLDTANAELDKKKES